jgi:hypothetical protein
MGNSRSLHPHPLSSVTVAGPWRKQPRIKRLLGAVRADEMSGAAAPATDPPP